MISSPFSWRVSHAPIRVVIIIIMDHSYNNNNKWRSDAICNDPRVWINHGSTMDQHGSTWINPLQPARRGSCVRKNMYPKTAFRVHIILAHAFSLPAVAHVSCVMAHASWLTCQASWLMRHASCVMRHGSCVMRPDSWLMRPASTHVAGVRRPLTWQAFSVLTHASHVDAAPFSPIQPHSAPFSRRPLSVMTTTIDGGHSPMLVPLDLRPLSCTAWGNTTLLPMPYSSTGTNKNSGRRFQERRPLFLLIRKRPAYCRPCS